MASLLSLEQPGVFLVQGLSTCDPFLLGDSFPGILMDHSSAAFKSGNTLGLLFIPLPQLYFSLLDLLLPIIQDHLLTFLVIFSNLNISYTRTEILSISFSAVSPVLQIVDGIE